ncbi:DUF4404 family protein [Azomonas macrocytogenes]|uniref:Chromosome partitioning protein ParA n=1 Tax=Azomonas macrocytogenes TaxID=69962 RepID=A0A839T1G3_AZOMA|nr:DUF4404 family protein [Azomonas macrocytogenes]MBB3102356.1 hypothetical protein [Azomonas macrocytogenes]
MSARNLQTQLQELRNQLEQGHPMTDEERASLETLVNDIELRLESERSGTGNESLIDGINLAVERFEASHPNTASTLRNIMQSLVSMGV